MKSNITFIGLGYIGLPTALLASNNRNFFYGFDIDKEKIDNLKNKLCYLKEEKIQKVFNKKFKLIKFVSKLPLSEIYVVCVPTPIKKLKNNFFIEDSSIINGVFNDLGKILKKNDLVIIESTCSPNTAYNFYEKTRKEKKIEFFVATCPERAIPGATIDEILYNPRIIGGVNRASAVRAKNFYKEFIKGKILLTSSINAELSKLFENTYRDVNIALANQFDEICKKFKTNYKEVFELANYHPRVNIHNPGIGVGGHCIPVDPWFLLDRRYKDKLFYQSRIIDFKKKKIIFSKIIFLLKKNIDKKILLFGTSYKEDTDDVRNSSALEFALKAKKIIKNVNIYDPNNNSINNISDIDVKKSRFDLVIVFVKHSWLKKNKIKTKKIIFIS